MAFLLLTPVLADDAPAPAPATDAWSSFWSSVGDTAAKAGIQLATVAAIIVGAVVLSWVLKLVIRRVVRRIVEGAKTKAHVDDTRAIEVSPLAQVRIVQRTRTLGSILQNIVNVTVVIIALLLIIQILNRDLLGSLTLLTAAIGAGLGFGAQNIVKDVLNGIFLVAEDQIGIGDVVDLGLATGIVEYVSVRITTVRDVNGTLWFVRNGEVLRIGNMSMGWSRVIIDLAVPTDADVEEVEKVMLTTAKTLAKDAKWRSRVLEQPEIWGLESISGDALVIRLVIKTRVGAKDDVARELRMRLKHAIDELGIALPQLNSIILTGVEGAQSIRGANPPKTKPVPTAHAPSMTKKPAKASKAAEVDPDPVWKPRQDATGADATGADATPSTSTDSTDTESPS